MCWTICGSDWFKSRLKVVGKDTKRQVHIKIQSQIRAGQNLNKKERLAKIVKLLAWLAVWRVRQGLDWLE